jgi:hypothetical protein
MVTRLVVMGLLPLLLLLLFAHPVLAQPSSCDPGYTLDHVNVLTSSASTSTMPSAGYVQIVADGLYSYAVNGGAGQQRTFSVRVALGAGDTISYRLLTATNGDATHCVAISPTPTVGSYPAPGATPTPSSSPSPTVTAYPAPSPIAIPSVGPALDGMIDATVEIARDQSAIWMPNGGNGRGAALLTLAGTVLTIACAHLLRGLVWRKDS